MIIVSYIRVSTRAQEASGLGLEAQRQAVQAFARQRRGDIIAEYREVETGKWKDRPELAKALAHCRRSKSSSVNNLPDAMMIQPRNQGRHSRKAVVYFLTRANATLVVAKLDRLARNVAFTSALIESKVDFVCCDNPHATKLTIHILAAVAEHEAEAISQRTKAALAAAKARGVKLGSARPGHWDGREDRRLAGVKAAAKAAGEAHARAAEEAYVDLCPLIGELRAKGFTLQTIADKLNGMGHTTRHGKSWSHTQVARLLQRIMHLA